MISNSETALHGADSRVRSRLASSEHLEFPAYAARLAQIREALSARGFDPGSAWANNMLEQIHSECESGANLCKLGI